MKIGLFPMVADVLHAGHTLAIEEAKMNCDYLIVALYCNPKRKDPVQTIYERYMQLRAVKWINEIIPYSDERDMEILLRSLRYDVYFLGEDYKDKDFECSNVLTELNKEVFYLTRQHTLSSSNLKAQVIDHAKGNCS